MIGFLQGMDSAQTLFRYARSFLAGTALSRVSGLFRDVAMAICFGSTAETAAFFVAFRLSNLFRRLLGEGNLQAGFVPQFTALGEQGTKFYRDLSFSLGFILLATIAFSELVCYALLFFVNPDWAYILELTMWMLPGLFFICLYGLNSALLQCRKKYFLPAAAPIAFNLIWIIAAFLAPDMKALSIAITLAFAGQWLVTLPLSELKLKDLQIFSPECRKLFKPLMLGLIGVGAVQFNSALDPIFARIADLKGPAYLWYAIRLQQLPFALFGLALSNALLPSLSRTTDPATRKELLQSSLFQASRLMLFFTFGIFALGKSGISLLYGHGDFTPADILETARCLSGYGLGLVPAVFVLLLAARNYSEKDYKKPALASLYAVLANIFLNALFVFYFEWGALSIALATSLSSVVNAAVLARGAFTKEFWKFFFNKTIFFAAAAALTLTVESYVGTLPRVLEFGILSALYLALSIRTMGMFAFAARR